ncbi:AAA family ATPase [Arcticibacter svalbardensis]|uniref:AAA family ATPase n=1 Tax=Arcticibacter svalbardensis TaxID=1288027 RepID=UPI001F3AC7EB|nr:AAA family ATPase [Arcticibacter svalbardensis]
MKNSRLDLAEFFKRVDAALANFAKRGIVRIDTYLNKKNFAMQLHYIWVKDFKNIKAQGFSFSDRFKVSYDPDEKVLEIIDNPLDISNFFPGNVNSVTGVIGANGAGKSNLFEFIKYMLASFSPGGSTVFDDLSAIVVFDKCICIQLNIPLENENELAQQGYEILRFKDSLPNLLEGTEVDTPDFLRDGHPLYENSYIFYSNIFDHREEYHLFELMDISTNHLVSSDLLNHRYNNYDTLFPKSEIDSLTAFRIMETERQLDFLADRGHSLPFKLPSSVIIQVDNKHNKYFKGYSSILEENGLTAFDKIIYKPWGDMGSDDEESLKLIYRRMFVYKLTIMLQLRRPDLFLLVREDDFSDFIFNDSYERFAMLMPEEFAEQLKSFLKTFDLLLKVSLARKRLGKYDSQFEYYDVIDTPLNEATLPLVLEFFRSYNKLIGIFSFLAFHWEGLSSGEQAVFNIYSRFHYAFQNNVVTKSRHVVIMLDEPESSLHPASQSKLLNDLLMFFSQNLPSKTIQLIVTSHSPFLVSDLPKTMINFLDRDAEGNCVVEGAAYLNAPATEPAYERIKSSLLKAFKNMPGLELPQKDKRIFELRRYEHANEAAGIKKREMFNEGGEIDIFKRLGFKPVFFGETIIGEARPNLIYMVTFDDMAAHGQH